MTRFVAYDLEVAARIAQVVGPHRVELRENSRSENTINPALLDAITSPKQSVVLMPSTDEQVLVVKVSDGKATQENAPNQKVKELREIGSQPSGFLGLHDEAAFEEDEDPPRSLWKKNE